MGDTTRGQEACPTCGKVTWLVTHSCPGIRATDTGNDDALIPCCAHCGCTDDRSGHDDTCSHGCNDPDTGKDDRIRELEAENAKLREELRFAKTSVGVPDCFGSTDGSRPDVD
jgi:phage terminase large subunit GpA-like protein